jgi:hypothetical protein
MALFCPHYTAGSLKLRAHLDAIRLSVHSAQLHAIAMRSAPSSLPASTTDTQTPATEFEDAGCSDWSSTTADDCAADEETVWKAADCEPTHENGEMPQLLEDNTAPHQPSQGDQIARLGSLAMYWSPWEYELLQDEFWDSGSDVESDDAGI